MWDKKTKHKDVTSFKILVKSCDNHFSLMVLENVENRAFYLIFIVLLIILYHSFIKFSSLIGQKVLINLLQQPSFHSSSGYSDDSVDQTIGDDGLCEYPS